MAVGPHVGAGAHEISRHPPCRLHYGVGPEGGGFRKGRARHKHSAKRERPKQSHRLKAVVPLSLALTEYAQQVEEQVDEVEVERQRPHEGHLLGGLAHVVGHHELFLYLLRVVGREADKH